MTAAGIGSLRRFYEVMHSTIPIRRALTEDVLHSRPASPHAVNHLRAALAELEAIPEEAEGRRLTVNGGRTIHVDLGYEVGELRKDLLFLDHGGDALFDDLAERHGEFRAELEDGLDAMSGLSGKTFITDRDGTINNYCGRYASSIQSIYNAVFLTRFARAGARASVILTSAPLDGIGLADIAVTPPGALIFAGSKGREYFDSSGNRRRFPIDPEKQSRLDALNDGLDALVRKSDYEVFTLIGSGLQRKFGQTTVAHQDITGSVAAWRSVRFREAVHDLVQSLDPAGLFFRIEDTGLDLELILTIDSEAGAARDFDKGDGVRFLNTDLALGMAQGGCLVCGDTASDLPMMTASLELAPDTRTVFVTHDEDLRRMVRDTLPETVFLSEPDTLVAILNTLSGN